MLPQVLLQLTGPELEKADALLTQGQVGLEVIDFARPALLAAGWEQRLAELLPRVEQWAGPITMHGPFLDLSPASPDPGVRRLTLQRYRQALHIAAQLKAKFVVFHTQYNPNIKEPAYLNNWLVGNIRFWTELMPEVEASETCVVLENLWDPKPDHIASLLAEINSPRLRSCLDVAHAHLFSAISLPEWVDGLGDYLAYVHLSDNRGQWDDHIALGEGEIDFSALLTTIEQRALSPWYVFEITSFEAAWHSLRYLGWTKN